MFNLNVGVKGRFKFIVHKENKITRESEWTDNLVLDNGLKNLGNKSIASFCRVGTGSSEPHKDQLTLDAQVASTSSYPEGMSRPATGVDVQNEYFWARYTFRFDTGRAAGRLSEVGVGWGAQGETLFNRALLRDAKGQKVTITVLEDETLDVIVEIRNYVSSIPNNHTLTAIIRREDNSEQQVEYNVRMLPLYESIGSQHVLSGGATLIGNSSAMVGYGRGVASTTTTPASLIKHFNTTVQPYTTHYQRNFEGYWGINEGNGVPLKSVVIRTTIGSFQAEITPSFNKTPQYVLRLEFQITWSRRE